MMTPARTTRFSRTVGLGLGALVGFGALLGAAAPANAVEGEFSISGTAFIDGDRPKQISEDLVVTLSEYIDSDRTVEVASMRTSIYDGSFRFSGLGEADYTIRYTSEDELFPAEQGRSGLIELDGDVDLPEMILQADPLLLGGEIVVTGDPVVGETLTATVGEVTGAEGQDVVAEFDLNWGYGRGQSGGFIEGAAAPTLVVPEETVGATVSYAGYVSAEDHRPTLLRSNGLLVSAPVEAAAPAPVADSSGLAAYLEANFVEPIPAAEAGLPANVDPTKSQVVSIDWFGGDSYVDVYAYSAPVFVGTFPVVDGRVQLTLTPAVLAALGAGSHTLVYTGQSSGTVQAVVFSVSPALASTGFAPTLPLGIAGGLLILGAGLMVAKRRGKAAHKA